MNTELAWAAGFYDGEGSCSLAKRPCNPSIVISIGQVGDGPGLPSSSLERFQAAVHAGNVCGPYTKRSNVTKNPKPIYEYRLYTIEKVTAVFESLRPYLCPVKVDQFEVCIDTYWNNYREPQGFGGCYANKVNRTSRD